MENVKITERFLKVNKNVMFVRADKGKVSVAINKDDYFVQGESLFGDKLTYEKLSKFSEITYIIK